MLLFHEKEEEEEGRGGGEELKKKKKNTILAVWRLSGLVLLMLFRATRGLVSENTRTVH